MLKTMLTTVEGFKACLCPESLPVLTVNIHIYAGMQYVSACINPAIIECILPPGFCEVLV